MEKKKKSKQVFIFTIVLSIIILAIAGLLIFTSKETKITTSEVEEKLATSEYMDIKGIYVDKSDEEKNPDQNLLYVLYSVKSNDKNLQFSLYSAEVEGSELSIKVNNTNSYKDLYANNWTLQKDFEYTEYENLHNGQQVLAGTSLNVVSVFRVSKNDLRPDGIISLQLKCSSLNELQVVDYKTNDVVYLENAVEILQTGDSESYEKSIKMKEEYEGEISDRNTYNKLATLLQEGVECQWYNGGYPIKLTIVGNRFTVSNILGSNGGTYLIRNKVILLNYDNGEVGKLSYEFDGENLNANGMIQ